MKIIFSAIILLLIATTSCSKDQAEEIVVPEVNPCDSISPSFSVDVQPIFNNECVTCHSTANSSSFANGQVWETHAEIFANKESILTAIKHEPGKTPMPFNGTKMSDSLIQVIECWIHHGAQDN